MTLPQGDAWEAIKEKLHLRAIGLTWDFVLFFIYFLCEPNSQVQLLQARTVDLLVPWCMEHGIEHTVRVGLGLREDTRPSSV